MTGGGENESMGGIDLVNLRQWCETNCVMRSPKLGQTGREREGGRERFEGRRGEGLYAKRLH